MYCQCFAYVQQHNKPKSNLYVGRKRFLISGGALQGGQIGQIFAQRVIVCFGQLRENYKRSPHFWATLFNAMQCINFDKTRVGLHFGQIFHKLIWSPWRGALTKLP
jgi:hypothetical protein